MHVLCSCGAYVTETPMLPFCRPGVAKGKGKEGKGPLGKHPISQAPKLDDNLNKIATAADEASDASSADSVGTSSSQEAAADASHAAVHASSHQGAPPSTAPQWPSASIEQH